MPFVLKQWIRFFLFVIHSPSYSQEIGSHNFRAYNSVNFLFIVRDSFWANHEYGTQIPRHIIRVKSARDTEPMIFDVAMIILVFVSTFYQKLL